MVPGLVVTRMEQPIGDDGRAAVTDENMSVPASLSTRRRFASDADSLTKAALDNLAIGRHDIILLHPDDVALRRSFAGTVSLCPSSTRGRRQVRPGPPQRIGLCLPRLRRAPRQSWRTRPSDKDARHDAVVEREAFEVRTGSVRSSARGSLAIQPHNDITGLRICVRGRNLTSDCFKACQNRVAV